MRNKLPGQTMIAVEEHELARLREIARCFRCTDSTNLEEILDSFRLHGEKMGGVYADCISRLQVAAKLAEEEVRRG